jgi:hypothetical protein
MNDCGRVPKRSDGVHRKRQIRQRESLDKGKEKGARGDHSPSMEGKRVLKERK